MPTMSRRRRVVIENFTILLDIIERDVDYDWPSRQNSRLPYIYLDAPYNVHRYAARFN